MVICDWWRRQPPSWWWLRLFWWWPWRRFIRLENRFRQECIDLLWIRLVGRFSDGCGFDTWRVFNLLLLGSPQPKHLAQAQAQICDVLKLVLKSTSKLNTSNYLYGIMLCICNWGSHVDVHLI